MPAIAGGLFDLGGVVTASPLAAIARYERDHGPFEADCRTCGIEVIGGVKPEHAAFLDDIGGNLKPARALGMATIKVSDPMIALRELSDLLGFALG